MAASLLRRGTFNSQDIKFELEATRTVYEEEKAAMKKLGPKLEVSPATKRLWQELQQEMIALEGLYVQATGEGFHPPEPVCEREMRALEVFFEAMRGRRWLNLKGWLGRTTTANTRGVLPFSCNPWCWDGVQCGVGDIQGLSLAGNQLQGVLPGAALADLRGLVTLDLSDNEIGGELPPEIGDMAHLQYLRCCKTVLEGPIPDALGRIQGLRELDLSCARLSGGVPASIACCVKLALLNLSQNRLEGWIPPEIGCLHGLRELSLGHNQLTGPIPASIGALVRLRSLSLSCNSLSGTLSPWLGKLTCLKRLLLDHNQLSGRLPKTLGELRDLEVVHLQFNNVGGPVPTCLGKLQHLRILNLAGNRLEGKVPSELGSVTTLVGLELGHNLIVGPLPAELGNLSRLLDLHVVGGCPSYSLPLHRGFTRHAFERIFVSGPALGLNNTTFPCGEMGLNTAFTSQLSAV